MRLQVKHVEKLMTDAAELQASTDRLNRLAKSWCEAVKYDYDQYTTSLRRNDLVIEIEDYRQKLGALYDHMSERGLRETANTNGN